jgi:protein-histidine pros-kinase
VGKAIEDLVVPPDRRLEENAIQLEALEQGCSTIETVRHRKDGTLICVVISTNAIFDEGGRVQYFVSSKKDVTRLRVVRDARMVEAKFRDLLELTPDAIVMANPTGRIVLATTRAENLFGYERGELLGKLVEVLLPERFHNRHADHRTRHFDLPQARGMGADLELYGVRKDGSEFPVEVSLSPVETEDGISEMSAIRDITYRKGIEKALHEKNEQLLHAALAKNRFLASMSHELRTPLNGVIGFAEFLVDGKPGPLNDKQKEYLNDILNSGRHLLQLINDVLDLAKVEAGKMSLLPETFSVQTAIEEVCGVARPLAQSKDIHVSLKVEGDLDKVFLDPQKFKQILYNLTSNAIKFTDNGGCLRIDSRPVGADRFEVLVEDTGIGIKTEDFERLFGEFEQLDSGTSRRYQGTGLGLALTRRIVELQGGSIAVKSKLGVGSTFTVELPKTGVEIGS